MSRSPRDHSAANSSDDGEPAAQTTLQRELRELCRGRGVHATDLDQRLGPEIRAKVGPGTPASQRAAVVEWLGGYLSRLPTDLRLAASVGLGLHPPAEARFLASRLQWLGEHVQREQRTVRRRLDEALKLLAELISDSEPPEQSVSVTDEWYMRRVRTLVRLDDREPEVFEERVIVPNGGGLDQITLLMSVPPAGEGYPQILADVLFGGLLIRAEHPSASQYRWILQLPRTISPHEEHRLCLRYRLPPEQKMVPHYALTPLSRCDEFELRVRFAVPSPNAWLLPGVPVRSLDDDPDELEPIEPDRVGEAVVRFAGLQRGLGYGLRWS